MKYGSVQVCPCGCGIFSFRGAIVLHLAFSRSTMASHAVRSTFYCSPLQQIFAWGTCDVAANILKHFYGVNTLFVHFLRTVILSTKNLIDVNHELTFDTKSKSFQLNCECCVLTLELKQTAPDFTCKLTKTTSWSGLGQRVWCTLEHGMAEFTLDQTNNTIRRVIMCWTKAAQVWPEL